MGLVPDRIYPAHNKPIPEAVLLVLDNEDFCILLLLLSEKAYRSGNSFSTSSANHVKTSISAIKSDPTPPYPSQESEESGFATVKSFPPLKPEQLLQ